MGAIRYSADHTLRGMRVGNDSALALVETPAGGSASVTTPTVADAVVSRSSNTSAANNFRIIPTTPNGEVSTFRSNTPAVCSVDAGGNVAWVSNGACEVAVVAPPSVRAVRRTMTGSTTVNVDTFQSWAPGSLAAHIDGAIRAMVSGKTPGAATQAVLSANPGTASAPDFTRNAALFTGPLNLSAITVHTSAFGSNIFPVVLISPWHVIAGHVGCSPGQQIVFKRTDGGYEVRAVVSQVKLPDAQSQNFVGILDAPVNTITPMPLLSSTWASKLPGLVQSAFMAPLPMLNKGFTAGDWIRVIEAANISTQYVPPYLFLRAAADATLAAWSSPIIGGDSNGPVFVPINGAAVLLHCMTFANGGTFYGGQSAVIQAAMDTLGGAQALTFADVSGFTSF